MTGRVRWKSRALGLGIGVLADRILADPARFHPVAGFGSTALALEKRMWAPSRGRGLAYTVTLVTAAAGAGVLAERLGRRSAILTAVATWTVLGGTSLGRDAERIAAALRADDLDEARRLLPRLVGRDPSVLDADGVAGAVVESVAENTSDAVVGALFWGALAGIPGLLGYRAANTLDAMVGHHNDRYERFGTASARLDDLANLVPARLTGLLVAACAPLAGGRPAAAISAWRRDAAAHPSPNAGVCEAAFAGALDVRLGGRTVYSYRTEDRPLLGDGKPPVTDDIARAVTLSRAVSYGAAAVAMAAVAVLGRGTRRS
ncbi:adenosylcobinamide-phosphate synthase [Amycolatopsis xylanica]|uniref:Cobalamin biosynthesis protein CobD n=1 Tax=Amycolatopsis xylanica TaxID=589385 RepID=A0A1H2W1H2_9PSEU|nr:cobalamin biosynthesis protein [Amycolatopsis xylanica]SDW74420.1 adenosylcobinamide-phosphate synthase [Amycolatopsis xylanica]